MMGRWSELPIGSASLQDVHDFPTWVVAAKIRMSLKRDTRRDKLGSLGRLLIFDSTSLVKLDQSTPFLRHLADLGMTGL